MTKQWEKYREVIIAEYKGQNKPLHEVQRIMRERYGFKASYVKHFSLFLPGLTPVSCPHDFVLGQ